MDQALTEGARRVLELAARLASEARAPATEPIHLLWALALDESRASELLEHHGIRLEVLQSECPLYPPDPGDEEPTRLDVEEFAPSSFPMDAALRDVLTAARALVSEAGRQYEIGTESLLFGLARTESPVAALLQRYGLGIDRAAAQAHRVAGLQSQPIDVDFRIAWRHRPADEQTDTLRILDASANRAREGLRVVEDWLRFARNDSHLAELSKQCRHDVTAAIAPLEAAGMLAARDTIGDVGVRISTAAEMLRETPESVLKANLKRAQEAIRTLEEFGKMVSSETSKAAERLRYRLYTLEKAILRTEDARRRLDGRGLYLLVTEEICHHGSGPAVREAVAHGATIVQVREKAMSDRQLLAHARRIREWCQDAGALCIVNDRPDIAVLADADGVHVGQDEISVADARRIVGTHRLVGVSTHDLGQARQAVLDGADYLGVGPVFPSTTKSFEQFAGLEFVRQVAAEITLPWYAIGGISEGNIADVRRAGAERIAVSGAICRAEQPGEATARLLDLLDSERA